MGVTDAAISLRRASKTNEMWIKNTSFHFSVVDLEKTLHLVRDFSKNTGTYEYY